AAEHAATLREFAAVLAGQSTAAPATPADVAGRLTDAALQPALNGLIRYCYNRGSSAVDLVEYAGAVLAGTTPTGGVAAVAVADGAVVGADAAGAAAGVDAAVLDSGEHDWFDVLGLLPAAVYRAAAPATDAGHREALLAVLESYARSGLTVAGSWLRRVRLAADGALAVGRGDVIEVGDRRLLGLSVDAEDREVGALEFASGGRVGPVPGYRITSEQVPDTGGPQPAAAG